MKIQAAFDARAGVCYLSRNRNYQYKDFDDAAYGNAGLAAFLFRCANGEDLEDFAQDAIRRFWLSRHPIMRAIGAPLA